VIAGLIVVWGTGIYVLDPIVAILVGAHLAITGVRLIRRSFDGLMDRALPADELEALRSAIRASTPAGTTFHALRTRRAGARRFADFHLLVPGATSVRDAHDLATKVEDALRATSPEVEITIHIEPIEDRASWEDNRLQGIEPPAKMP
jgi:cation diffusion facilitator family transporter